MTCFQDNFSLSGAYKVMGAKTLREDMCWEKSTWLYSPKNHTDILLWSRKDLRYHVKIDKIERGNEKAKQNQGWAVEWQWEGGRAENAQQGVGSAHSL